MRQSAAAIGVASRPARRSLGRLVVAGAAAAVAWGGVGLVAFTPSSPRGATASSVADARAAAAGAPATPSSASARRSLLLLGLLPLGSAARAPADASVTGAKVTVLGGSGFIGSRICERLVAEGAAVTSVSRGGGPPPGAGPWAAKVSWLQGDLLSMDLSGPLAGAEAVVSAVGALGSANDEAANGATAEAAVVAAVAANAKRFVLVSASPDVAAMDSVFGPYVKGKRRAEAAVASAFPANALILQPSFVYGGDAFSANPPRVAAWYGEKIEGLLGTGPFRAAAGVFPASFFSLALSPPSSVADVAAAAASGALGKTTGTLPGHDAILAAARAL